MLVQTSWHPKERNVRDNPDRPEWVDLSVYHQAQAAKYHYNVRWEFWVYLISLEYNCSQAKAEDACIRGIKKEINRFKLVFGDKVGTWFEEFLEMGDIFNKVNHPIYLPRLGD